MKSGLQFKASCGLEIANNSDWQQWGNRDCLLRHRFGLENCKLFCLTTMMKSGLSFKESFWSWKLQIILTGKTDEIRIVVLFGLEMPEILSAPRAKCRIITLRTGSTNTFTNTLQIRFNDITNTLQKHYKYVFITMQIQ